MDNATRHARIAHEMLAWPVSTKLNTPKNNGPELIHPWQDEPQGFDEDELEPHDFQAEGVV
jgi:hypothetical protein